MSANLDSTGTDHPRVGRLVSPLRHLDTATVDAKARRETRNREVHLPPITAYRWWARRTEAINGAILDAFALDRPGRLLVCDPFAGGGVIPLAARLRGHQVYAQDLNPWAAAGLVGMMSLPNGGRLRKAGHRLHELAKPLLADAYATTYSDGSAAEIAHTFRVVEAACSHCGWRQKLFPHALLTLLVRRERKRPEAFLACRDGHVFLGREDQTCSCPECGSTVDPTAVYTEQRKVRCRRCDRLDTLEQRAASGWSWEPVLVQRSHGRRRELALITSEEREQAESDRWVPTWDLGAIPPGQETRVLLRHGFREWIDLYPRRQRAVLEALLNAVPEAASDDREATALTLAIVGSAEMAGQLSRWDRFYLKSYESMAGHRFNFTTFSCEPNVWGASASGRGTVRRRIESLAKAAEWLEGKIPVRSRIEGPLEASRRRTPVPGNIDLRVVEGSSERMLLPAGSVDLVLTDPPYHDDVQYSELSLPLRGWAQLHMDRLDAEALVNQAVEHNHGEDDYRDLLRRIFAEAARTMRPDGHLIFSYANREPEAWIAVLGALQDAGLRASGYCLLHSENETDVAKRGVRACTLDLLMDLVPASGPLIEVWEPREFPETAEGQFLRLVGRTFARIGDLSPGWESEFARQLRASEFLGGTSRPESVAGSA